MYEKVYSNPDVYKIFVPLPDNPLQNLNCFVVKCGKENLIIDTGFNRPECEQAIMEGLKELDVDINTSVLYASISLIYLLSTSASSFPANTINL